MLDRQLIGEVLSAAMATGADHAEVFIERTRSKSIGLLDNAVHSVEGSDIAGLGLRVYKGLRTVYGSTGDLSRSEVLALARRVAEGAAAAPGSGAQAPRAALVESVPANVHPVRIVPSSVENRTKIDILRRANKAARDAGPAIVQVRAFLIDTDRSFLVADSDGLCVSDRQIRTRLGVSSIAADAGGNQAGFEGPGFQGGLEIFEGLVSPEETGAAASRQALTNLRAGYCEAGTYPVAIERGIGGVIFHEAVGHSLEATSVACGQSEFAGKAGLLVASPKLTAVDDGTLPGQWGSFNIDDEGRPSQRNVLIENGVLKGYLVDAFNARRMAGAVPTGSARRQDFNYAPTSRMSNTFIVPGTDEDEDIIGSIELGVYCRSMGGGSVNPLTGAFNFGVSEGYMIRNGKIAEAVRGATLIGKGSEVIRKIDMVGKRLELAAGMCGSLSGAVPVCIGQPLIRVSSITVGGR